jgi:hypothetical protein
VYAEPKIKSLEAGLAELATTVVFSGSESHVVCALKKALTYRRVRDATECRKAENGGD